MSLYEPFMLVSEVLSAPLVSGWGESPPLERLEKEVNQGLALVWDPTRDGSFILFPVSSLWAAPC